MVKAKILIIEDDKFLVNILEDAIDQNKFEVILAIDSAEGIEKAIKELPAVIVLDVLLPSKSGFDCLKTLKATKATKNIPVIILSNLGQDDEIRKGLKLGAVDYLVKSNFKIDEIVDKIISAIG